MASKQKENRKMITLIKNKSIIVTGIFGAFLSILLALPLYTINANAIVAHVALDVILVVDKSGSMGGTALSSEKTAAKAFIDKMDPVQDQVSIVAFSNSASTFQLTNNFANAKNYVDSISAGGGTDYNAALNAASAEFSSTRRRPGNMPILIFMSDGVPNTESGVLAKCAALEAMGVQIYTIALGGSSTILTDMASSNAGTTDHYFNAPSAADLAQIYIALANLLQAPNITFIGSYTGTLTLNTSTLAPNKTVVLKVNGTVIIAGNQTYDSNNKGAKYKDISQLPQLVIIANKIIINNAVTNVDAWLIARGSDGTIQTCEDTSASSINKCTNKLTVNGPVMANHLNLLRTAGSGTGAASNDPAEVFNLRADAYLWAAAHTIAYGRAQTVYTSELPARF
jgi:uncharacterized protein YegL